MPVEPADLAFVEEVESRLRDALGAGATLRCRITRNGVIVEHGVGDDGSQAARIAAAACADGRRTFLGARPYRRGAAFLRSEAE